MRSLLVPVVVGAALVSAVPARADIPTADATLLTERAQTSSTTIKLIPIKTERKDADQGVNCAVTTGKKASITNPTVTPQAGAGARTIQSYAPDMPSSPTPEAKGGTLSGQTHFKATADVVAGLEASRSTLGAAAKSFGSTSWQVGTAPTVMGALDMNSAARVSNNIAWNGAVGSVNVWVTALNALNLVRASDASRVATGMRLATTTIQPRLTVPACPTGSTGSGTAADPCRSAGGACVSGSMSERCTLDRFVDGDGNVLAVLLPTGSVRVAGPSSQPLSFGEAIQALASSSTSAP